jgi:hypothetical protein
MWPKKGTPRGHRPKAERVGEYSRKASGRGILTQRRQAAKGKENAIPKEVVDAAVEVHRESAPDS